MRHLFISSTCAIALLLQSPLSLARQQSSATASVSAEQAVPASLTVSDAVFDSYVGDYQLAPNFVLNVRREGSRFLIQATGQPAVEVRAKAQQVFVSDKFGAEIRFEKDSDGKFSKLVLRQGGRELPAQRVVPQSSADKQAGKALSLPAAVFDTYVGQYQLAPNFVITISRDGERFLAQASGQPQFGLIAVSETEFDAVGVAARIQFEKLADGSVKQLILHQHGQHLPAARLR
ncbi:DUF3471 domain-containing protein [Undibacterium rugosum]|uniref:DUF3471 domain-containing protein n=1 Tax=Undibacterium rugosum TaxID=2762291 RepID=UPI001B81CCCB|nr:DUF3471 domain-containing protein [Undibacterium rugosum]MBR7777019.1 DUF3471 domain-containing protein [Undibacterium rugosum]